jgi:hypothetical protein
MLEWLRKHIDVTWRNAGLFSVHWETRGQTNICVHVVVARRYWQWGRSDDWYDGPWCSFGCGPLFLICWC